jgi:hypothetical protein
VRHADTVVRGSDPIWFHRNELRPDVFQQPFGGSGSLWEQELRFAGLGSAIERGLSTDPLTNRSFGAALHGETSTATGGAAAHNRLWQPLPAPALGIETPHAGGTAELRVHVLSAKTATVQEYVSALRHVVSAAPSFAASRVAHAAQWSSIWGRSRVQILSSTNASQNVEHTTAMFVATRYIALCEQRGGPKKFNGGIFNPDLGSLHGYCTDVPAGGVGGQCSADCEPAFLSTLPCQIYTYTLCLYM